MARIQRLFEAKRLRNRLGEAVDSLPQQGWVDSSRQWFYPIVSEIPTLLADEAISMAE
jgi:uncharacterized protein YbaR (Trm112 family)